MRQNRPGLHQSPNWFSASTNKPVAYVYGPDPDVSSSTASAFITVDDIHPAEIAVHNRAVIGRLLDDGASIHVFSQMLN